MGEERQKLGRFARPALLLIDNQVGLLHPTYYGHRRSNPHFEKNLERLLTSFREHNLLVFHVAHHSTLPDSPLHPVNNPSGVQFFPFATPKEGEPLFIKNVNSAFIGTGLEEAIREAGVKELVVVGLTTEHCISTSVRMAANLGVVSDDGKIYLVGDAVASYEKGKWDAETVHQVNLACLDGEFAHVVSTQDVVLGLDSTRT